MRGESFTPDPENGYKRERERDPSPRNPCEKWAQNLGIRPASQPGRQKASSSDEYRFEPTHRRARRSDLLLPRWPGVRKEMLVGKQRNLWGNSTVTAVIPSTPFPLSSAKTARANRLLTNSNRTNPSAVLFVSFYPLHFFTEGGKVWRSVITYQEEKSQEKLS